MASAMSGPLELDQCVKRHTKLVENRSAIEVRQLDDEGTAHNLSAGPTEQLDSGSCGTPGRDQIVDQQDARARGNRIFVDLDAVGSVLKLIVGTDGLPGQFALLADRNERDG